MGEQGGELGTGKRIKRSTPSVGMGTEQGTPIRGTGVALHPKDTQSGRVKMMYKRKVTKKGEITNGGKNTGYGGCPATATWTR